MRQGLPVQCSRGALMAIVQECEFPGGATRTIGALCADHDGVVAAPRRQNNAVPASQPVGALATAVRQTVPPSLAAWSSAGSATAVVDTRPRCFDVAIVGAGYVGV